MPLVRRDRKRLAELLNTDDLRSKVIGNVALLDSHLGIGLTMYFGNADEDRWMVMHELIVDRLPFSQKISIFSKIPFKRRYKSLECIPNMRRLSRLRNHVAHTHYTTDVDRLFENSDSLSLLVDYPKVYDATFMKTKLQLWRVFGTKEFLEYVYDREKFQEASH